MTEGEPRRKGRPTIDEVTRSRIPKLAREGKSRNAVAREVGVSSSTVSKVCAAAEPPVTFDRAATAEATAAQVTDMKAQRAKLAQRMLDEVNALLDLTKEPHTVVGWYEGSAYEHELPRPQSSDVRSYWVSAGIAMDKHLALVRHDSDDRELPEVDRWIAWALGGAVSA